MFTSSSSRQLSSCLNLQCFVGGFLYRSAPGHPQHAEFVAEAVLVGWGSALCLLGEVDTGASISQRQDAGWCAGVRLARHLPVPTHCSHLKGKVL